MSYPNLNMLLQAANRRLLFLGFARTVAWGLVTFVLAVGCAVFLDAILALPVWGLIALDASLVVCLIVALSRIARLMRECRFDARRVARSIEIQRGLQDNSLINALDLSTARRESASRGLIDQSVRVGEEAARNVNLRQTFPGRDVKRIVAWAAAAVAMMLCISVAMPRVFARVLPRLLDPTGDHPPFSLLRFEVDVSPDPLFYGSNATIVVQAHGGKSVDRADIVFQEASNQRRLPMIFVDNGFRVDVQRIEHVTRFYIDTPEGRSDWYPLHVQRVPLFEDVWVSYEYPPYADWPNRRHRLDGRDIEALAGTRVTIEASSNYPLAAAKVQIECDDATPPKQLRLTPTEDPHKVNGAFSLTHSGQLSMRLVGCQQEPGPEERHARLVVVRDRPPHVAILDPEPMSLAVEEWTVPLAVEASDDIQIREVDLKYEGPDGETRSLPLEEEARDRRSRRGKSELDLAKLGLRAGDQIRLSATAGDNRPDDNQRAESNPHVIQVISQDDYLDYLRATYQAEQLAEEAETLNRELAKLGDSRDEVLARGKAYEEQLKDASRVAESDSPRSPADLNDSLQAHENQLEMLADALSERQKTPPLYDIEQDYRSQLDKLLGRITKEQQRVSELRDSLHRLDNSEAATEGDRRRFQESLQDLRQQGEPFADEQSRLATREDQLRRLQQAEDMTAEAERLQQVARAQRELADRFEALSDTTRPDQAMESDGDRLAREQERLQQQLDESLRSLREIAEHSLADLPESAQAADQMCDAIQQSGASADQQQSAQSARRGQLPPARASAKRAADKLESSSTEGLNAQSIAQEFAANSPDSADPWTAEDVRRALEQMKSSGSGSPSRDSMANNLLQTAGSRQRMGLYGPPLPIEAWQGLRGSQTREQHNGLGNQNDPAGVTDAERIQSATRSSTIGSAGNLRGVPIGYRDQAEAYFRRLAEEASRSQEEP